MLSSLVTTARTLPSKAIAHRGRITTADDESRDLATIARAMAIRIASQRIADLAQRSSYKSTRSLFSVFSRRSALSVASAWSVASVTSVGSIGSAGSIGSIGSAGSILSIGSAGSIMCIGASGSIGAVGGAGDWPGRESADKSELPSGGPDVARISGLMAVAAVIAAGAATFRRAA